VAESDPADLRHRLEALCYRHPDQAAALGRTLGQAGGEHAALGWLHVALAEMRSGDCATGLDALVRARQGFEDRHDDEGLAWCDEVQAIALRRAGDYAASAALHAELDRRGLARRPPLYRFVAHNSRAITAKLEGDTDAALRHFYAAHEAALDTGLEGPRITAIGNLGGYHQDLYNLDDARRLSEEALAQGRQAGMRVVVTVAAANLVVIHHAAGEPEQARAMAAFMLEHPEHVLPNVAERYPLPLALEHGAVTGIADGDGLCEWGWIKAQCLLARGNATGARELAEQVLRQRELQRLADQPYPVMQLLKALSEACEQLGDFQAALRWQREAHDRYVHLVGRSARARYIALEVGHRLQAAQRERDLAVQGHRVAEDDRRRLVELNAALQAKIAETEQLHQQLREQALHDPLTGLFNRRYLFEAGPGLLELARRQQGIACVVLLDLDHFKLLNDTYGHAAGDRVLQRFAQLLQQQLRRSDIVCRYGGEEFVAVMPDLDADAAAAVLGRLQEALRLAPPEPGKRRLPSGSFSAGIAVYPRHGHTLEVLLQRADKALYAAKHQGRARIEQVPATGFGTLA
jgi:diguanylate cyclase (GGDEF)-like protein